jgi:uncharacterized protein (TIGR00297 family)
LSTTGALAAMVAGTITMAAGWSWAIILIGYFVSATLLSRFRAADKERRTQGRVEKHGARDATQVLANGGAFVVMALGFWMRPHALWMAFAAGALAASAADTWATELGVLARGQPRSILTWKPVDVGTSGGITTQGFAAGIAGAMFIALVAWMVRWPAAATASALVGGILGCTLDSIIGASLQARRWCASCDMATEQRIHRCGAATTRTGGLAWLDNDGVNALATVGGALLGAAATAFL